MKFVSNGGYEKGCSTYDYYVSTQSKCPSDGTNVCKIITESMANPYSSCTITTTGLPYTGEDLSVAANSFYNYFQQFIGSSSTVCSCNKGLIRHLKYLILDTSSTSPCTTPPSPYDSLKKIYDKDVEYLKKSLGYLKEAIDVVYNKYAEYVNVEALENGTYVSVFSWINCSVFGKDINATLNTMKKQLRGDLRIIFFISLTNDCIIIGIMVVVTFLLNWYKFDPLENNPVGEMEIGEKKKEYDGDEIYSDGLSSSNNNSEKIHDDSDNDYGTDDIEFRKKSEMQKLNDEQSNNSQFGDNINNPNKINVENKNNNNNNRDDISSDSGIGKNKKYNRDIDEHSTLKKNNETNTNMSKNISRNPLIG